MSEKIDASQYTDLVQTSDLTETKEPGPFIKVFITGQPREGQTPGTMSAIYPQRWNDAGDDKYLIKNESSVYFIPMFLKKVREVKEKQNGQTQLVWFSYNPDSDDNYPENAKIAYIFAGALLDSDLKPIKDKIEPERTAFVYFKNEGSKVGEAFEYINKLQEAASELAPLSDDPDIEKKVITPKRFICEVITKLGNKNKYGNTPYIFEYNTKKQIPDNTVKDILDRSQKWLTEFNKQFDSTKYTVQSVQDVKVEGTENVTFDDDSTTEEQAVSDDIPDEELDLGL